MRIARPAFLHVAMLSAMLLAGCTTPGKISVAPEPHERKDSAQHTSAMRLSTLESDLLFSTNEFRLRHGWVAR